jgi:glutaminyl-peptide cyclotransferase
VGDADQQLYWEWSSTRWLQEQVWAVAHALGYHSVFIPQYKHSVFDDHVPFLYYDIPAIDIIDFDYPYWHTSQDTQDKVSPESLERVGRVLETLLEGESVE